METTTTSRPDTGRRTGALWVAATGGFLLFAAAAVFIAVRWDELPDGAKLAVVGALTGGFLAAGRSLRRTVPATGDVLFHLGAFLIPVDLAAINLRLGAGWRALLLSEGALVTVGLGGLGRAVDSVVLRAAGIVGGVALAGGIAATTDAPGPLVLAVLAAVALAGGERTAGRAWAVVAGLSPVLSAAAGAVTRGAGVLADLGFAGDQRLVSFASGTVAAVLLAREAHRDRSYPLAGLAVAAFATGLADGWFATDPSESGNLVGVAALFLLVQLTAAAVRHDPFWSRPATFVTSAFEGAGGLATMWMLGLVAIAPLADLDFWGSGHDLLPPYAEGGAAAALVAAGWIVATLRRPVSSLQCAPTACAAAIFAVAAVEVTTGDPVPTALALVGAAAALGAAAERLRLRPMLVSLAVALAAWAPLTAWEHPAVAPVVGVAAAAVLTAIASRRDNRVVALASVATGWVGLALAHPVLTWEGAAAAGVVTAWLTASALPGRSGRVVSWTVGLPVVLATGWTVAALATVAYVVEAIRRDDPRLGNAAAIAVQFLVVHVAQGAGLDAGQPGVALCVAAVVWGGLAALVEEERWQQPFLVAAGAGAVLGIIGASIDPRSMASATIVTGGLLVAAGLASRVAVVAHLGGLVTTAGIAGHLLQSDVVASEAYVAPVALQLVVAGWAARRRHADDVSSWVAYAPAIALLGGSALAERISGGAGWHALVAGGVGVLAVAAGGWQRLAAPLFLGTALVVATTGHESLGAVAGVPTWGWLALGGTLLLGAGVAMERSDTSPVEAGRRVVDLVSERFD